MKTLVIGGGGFAGKYLLKILDGDIYASSVNAGDIQIDNVRSVALDICSADSVDELLKELKPDRIYHLAAQSSAAKSWEAPADTAKINIIGTINVLEGMRKYCPKARLLVTGSSEEYGNSEAGSPVNEDSETYPVNPYAVTKLTVNMICRLYHTAYGLDIISTRSFNHIGAGQAENFAAVSFSRQIAEIELDRTPPIIYVGNLSAVRDFTDVRDVARAYTMLMEHGKSGNTYNVGGGYVCTVYELLNKLLSLSYKEISVVIDKKRFRPQDTKGFSADISKLKRDTGFVPEIPIEKTLKDLLDYERQRAEQNI